MIICHSENNFAEFQLGSILSIDSEQIISNQQHLETV